MWVWNNLRCALWQLNLKIQAATVYWHFKSKQDLIDEMATVGFGRRKPSTIAEKDRTRTGTYGPFRSERDCERHCSTIRDGARLVAGSRLTDTRFMTVAESIATTSYQSRFHGPANRCAHECDQRLYPELRHGGASGVPPSKESDLRNTISPREKPPLKGKACRS